MQRPRALPAVSTLLASTCVAQAANHPPARAADQPANAASAARTTGAPAHLERTRNTLSREIEAVLKESGIPSLSIALMKDDRLLWTGAFGYSNVKLKVPATPDTIYSTGSCFKSVTAMAVMQLVESGKLKLDAPANEYLGVHRIRDMSAVGKPVTLRHLLSHHSGLVAKGETPAENSVTVPLWERRLPKTLEELTGELEARDAPGATHRYSNYGYALAGLLVQKVSGRSYEQYIVEKILRPLGVEHSRPIHPTPEMGEEMALPYRLENGKAVPQERVRFDVYPAGDAYLSVPAMSAILLTHLNGGRHQGVPLLSSESLAEMHRPQLASQYGLGVGTRSADGERLITHAGGVPGYSTHFLLGLDSGVGVYLAANAGGAHARLTYLAQLSLDLLRGKKPGTGLVREIVGLGVALAPDETTGLVRITDVIPKSPARRARLTSGLIIQSINGVSVKGKTLQECVGMMVGPVGKEVRLGIMDAGQTEVRTVELRRRKFLIAG